MVKIVGAESKFFTSLWQLKHLGPCESGYILLQFVHDIHHFIQLVFVFQIDSKRDLQHKQDEKIQKGSGKHNCTSSPPTKGVVCIYCICIIESVDSICRDSADTQYMLIQKNSQNLQNS